MTPTIIIEPATVNMTGPALLSYGRRYAEAASRLPKSTVAFDPVPLHLYCQALELHLKAFIWFEDGLNSKAIKTRYGHDLSKLWKDSKARHIHRFAKVTPLRESVVTLVAPFYKRRSFAYLDLDMIATGFTRLKAEPRITATLERLVAQLGTSLWSPVFSAA